MGKCYLPPFLNVLQTPVKVFPCVGPHTHGKTNFNISFLLADAALLAVMAAFLFETFKPSWLFLPTVSAGGDTASHYYTAHFLAEQLLPRGRISGWCPGNYAGFPMLQYYFPGPFLLMAALSLCVPLAVAFKLVTTLAVFLLPPAAYLFFKALRQPFPAPVLAAAFSLAFLFSEGQTMWGGNIPSSLAGEFTYSFGMALAVAWCGLVYRAVETGRHIRLAALGLALVGFFHAYALLFAGFSTLVFLLIPGKFRQNAAVLVKIHALAFLLLGFWLIPLAAFLPNTTRFSILWIFFSLAQVQKEAAPLILLPPMALFALAVLFRAAGRRIPQTLPQPHVYVGFLALTGLLLYFAGYRAHVVDVRFLPFLQIFLVIGGALAVLPLAGLARSRQGAAALVFLAFALTAGTLVWCDSRVAFIDKWARSNLLGFETKPLWPEFKAVCEHLKAGPQDPRAVYEHSMVHSQAGSVRAFENLPFFSGRGTLEGVYIQASPTAPFVFYLQSEISKQASTPIPDFCYSRFRPERAAEHLALFNADRVVAAAPETRDALLALSQYFREFTAGPYTVFRVLGVPGRVAEPLKNRPVLLPEKDWRHTAYRWFRLGDLSLVPVFVDNPGETERAAFDTRAADGGGDILALAPRPLPETDTGGMTERVTEEEILLENAPVGSPVLVKTAFHPGWRAEGAPKIYLAGPGFMLVVPDRPTVRLVYGKTRAHTVGFALTLAGLLLCALPLAASRAPALQAAGVFLDRWLWTAAALVLILTFLGGAVFLGIGAPEFPATPFNKAIALFREKDYSRAETAFRDVLARHPQSLVAGEAAYHLAMCHFLRKDWDKAIAALDYCLKEFPDASRRAEVLYHKGLCLRDSGRREAAARVFEAVRREHPAEVWSKFAGERLGEMGKNT
jgi:hypothetical protein